MEVFTLSLVNLLAAVGITIVVPIISLIPDIFGVDQANAMWFMTAFMLSYASFMPIFGKLSDVWGRKKVFIAASCIYAAGLALSAISSDFILAVVARAIQGLGSGGILPVANAIAAEGGRKHRDLAIVNATYGLGIILGVNLGGIVYDTLGYGWLFALPFFVFILGIVFSAFFLKESHEGARRRIDWVGSLSMASTMIFFILGVQGWGWAFVVSVISLVAFIMVELKVEDPAVDIRSFRGDMLLYNVVAILFGITMFTTVTFLAPFTQVLLGYDVSTSVYSVDPFAGVMVLAIALGGMLSKKLGSRKALLMGTALLAAGGFLMVYTVSGELTYYLVSLVLGFGMGLPMTPLNDLVIEAGGSDRRGTSAGIVSIMRSIGGVIGPTIAGYIFSKVDFSSIFALDNIIQAYRNVYLVAAWTAFAAAVVSTLGLIKRKREVLA